MAEPQTITSRVTDQINILASKAVVTELDVAAVRRDIRALQQVNSSFAYMLSGMLNATLGSYEAAVRDHSEAMRRDPRSYIQLVNYATSLTRLARFDEAGDWYRAAFEIKGSLEVIISAFSIVVGNGRMSEIGEMINNYKSQHPTSSDDPAVSEAVLDYLTLEDRLDQVGVTEDKFKIIAALFQQTLSEHDAMMEGSFTALSYFERDPHLSIGVYVFKPPAILASMAEHLGSLIVQDERLDECWDKLIYTFYSVDKTSGMADFKS